MRRFFFFLITNTFQLAERLPYFIESCVEFIPELKDWNAIIKVLLTDRLDFDSRVHLTEVFNECVRHSLTGKCSKSRQVASKSEFSRYHFRFQI
jgi:hypothetical protein